MRDTYICKRAGWDELANEISSELEGFDGTEAIDLLLKDFRHQKKFEIPEETTKMAMRKQGYYVGEKVQKEYRFVKWQDIAEEMGISSEKHGYNSYERMLATAEKVIRKFKHSKDPELRKAFEDWMNQRGERIATELNIL